MQARASPGGAGNLRNRADRRRTRAARPRLGSPGRGNASQTLSKRRHPVVPVVLGLLAVTAGVLVVKYTRHHIFPRRFAVVEQGQIFRSGQLERGPLNRVLDDHDIRTILVLLNDEPDNPTQQMQAAVTRERGVEMIRIPMPGNGCAEFDALEAAAAVIERAEHRPLLVHCAAGVMRTGASLAVWRMNYQGWDVETALAEMIRHGYRPELDPRLRDHLQEYYRTRIMTARRDTEADAEEPQTPASP